MATCGPHHYLLVLFSLLSVISMPPSAAAAAAAAPASSGEALISFLQLLQSEALATLGPNGFDPKLYVDLPLKHSLASTVDAFSKLPRSASGVPSPVLKTFVDEFFGAAGSDLVGFVPGDFRDEPEGFLPRVENQEVRRWALEVHALWKNLSRRVSDDVVARPEMHTLLPLPEPVVVPGARFREVYYWDSYWTVRGLLVSKMYDTAKAIARNLIYLIETYGFVPNGARTYYCNRSSVAGRHLTAYGSQPPLLSSIVYEIYLRTGDLAFVNHSLPSLLKEYDFWNSGVHKVTIQDLQGQKHSLSRYYAMWNKPRPESATIDEESASKLKNTYQKEIFYRELASAAESGWDFSTRWMSNASDLTTLATTSIIPVDLNVYIYKMELDIAFFAKLLGNYSTSERFLAASKKRQSAMKFIFWNMEMKQWLDYWLVNENVCEEFHLWKAHNQNHNIFASNFVPLWIHAYKPEGISTDEIVKSLRRSGLMHPAGISTSLSNSGQQWDFPNGWAPLQHMIVEGLAKSDSKEARSLAEYIAVRWIRTNYAAYRETGAMHEKYDVEACGKIGGGGEYIPQTGFGWSNGVLLAFLEEFGWPSDRDINCE